MGFPRLLCTYFQADQDDVGIHSRTSYTFNQRAFQGVTDPFTLFLHFPILCDLNEPGDACFLSTFYNGYDNEFLLGSQILHDLAYITEESDDEINTFHHRAGTVCLVYSTFVC